MAETVSLKSMEYVSSQSNKNKSGNKPETVYFHANLFAFHPGK